MAVPGPPIVLPPLSDSGEQQLVAETVHWYTENVKAVEMLGREYGFEPLLYWQPLLFTKPNRGSFENEEHYKYSWAEPIFLAVYQRIANEPVLQSAQSVVKHQPDLRRFGRRALYGLLPHDRTGQCDHREGDGRRCRHQRRSAPAGGDRKGSKVVDVHG